MKKAICILLISFSPLVISEETEKPIEQTILQWMKISRFVGSCDTIARMGVFQMEKKLTGGDDFIANFMVSELGRMGLTMDEMKETCKHFTKQVDVVFEESKK